MFLRYLVDTKMVSEAELIQAIVKQLESMPSLIRILSEDDILPACELLSVLIKSIQNKTSIIEVLKNEGKITQDDLTNIIHIQNSKAESLGSILISLGHITREKYDQALREYSKLSPKEKASHSETTETASIEKPKEDIKETTPTQSAPAGISAAALESLMAVQGMDPDQLKELESQVATGNSISSSEDETIEWPEEESEVASKQVEEIHSDEGVDLDSVTVSEYLDFYSEELQSELLVVANRFRLKGKEKDLANLYENFVKILSLCKLNDFTIQAKLLESYEELLSIFLENPDFDNSEWRKEPFSMLDLLWDFRKEIELGNSEVTVFRNSEKKKIYLENIKRILIHSKRSA